MNILSSLLKFIGNNLKTTKTTSGLTPSTKIINAEYVISQVGKVITGYYVFRINAAMVETGEVLLSGLPKNATRVQVNGVCVAGTQQGKSNRFAIYGGNISTFYSSPFFTVGDTWSIAFTYTTA